MKFRFEVQFSGWMTRVIEADTLEEAEDLAAEIPEDLLVIDLQWKESKVENPIGELK